LEFCGRNFLSKFNETKSHLISAKSLQRNGCSVVPFSFFFSFFFLLSPFFSYEAIVFYVWLYI